MADKKFYFFLLPSEPLRQTLAHTIIQLAIDYHCVSFVPHMTVYGGASNESEAVFIGDTVTREFSPLRMTYQKLGFTELFYKTLFVQFEQSRHLAVITEKIRAMAAQPSSYKLNPHLSLLYQNISLEEKKRLSERIDVYKGEYLFDHLHIVAANPAENDEGVRSWQTVYEGKLKDA